MCQGQNIVYRGIMVIHPIGNPNMMGTEIPIDGGMTSPELMGPTPLHRTLFPSVISLETVAEVTIFSLSGLA